MKRRIKTIVVAILLVILSANTGMAQLNRKTVIRAWNRVFPLAGIASPRGSIKFENDKTPNAWVASNGKGYSVHVTKGLMRLLENEDQIAGIMGHEIAHIKLGHFKQSVGRGALWLLLLYGINKEKKDLTIPAALGMALAESGFSRQQEVAADDYGARLATRAGYSPWGLYSSIKLMKKKGFNSSPNGFNSHPPTTRRLKRLKAKAKELEKAAPRRMKS